MAHSSTVFAEGTLGARAGSARTTGAGAEETVPAASGDSAAAMGEGVLATALAEGATSGSWGLDDAVAGLPACIWRKPRNPPATATAARPTRPVRVGSLPERARFTGDSASVFTTGLSVLTWESPSPSAVSASGAAFASGRASSGCVAPAARRSIRSYD